MTLRLIYENDPDRNTSLTLGPRVRRDIQLQIHKLERKFHPTRHDLRDLEKLRSMLRLLTMGDSDDA